MLSLQPTLQDWTEPEIGAIVQHTKVREFPPNSVCLLLFRATQFLFSFVFQTLFCKRHLSNISRYKILLQRKKRQNLMSRNNRPVFRDESPGQYRRYPVVSYPWIFRTQTIRTQA